MSLVINHNMMAMNTARNLNNTYGRLSSSVERLSSGLRINSAADDAAGLAIRELMRADITTMQQGIRNAADAISMIQTADGGMAVIDEKLTRMKELAEQAATGTYTTLQREIINSEYQAMAAEIDRIATSTNFNGVKLLDGSITNLHGGLGMKIHFGVGNSPDEDYYFINTGDVRATSQTGLQIGGDAKNDIWGQGAAGAKGLAGPGCCTAGYDSLDGNAGFKSGQTFSYGYNWDWTEDDDPDLLAGRYLAGRYTVSSSDSLQDLINKVNNGTQSRVGIQLEGAELAAAIKNGGTAAVCLGNEAYIFGSAAVAGGTVIIPAVSGEVDRYLATGTYAGDDFRINQTNRTVGSGFGLSQAQIAKLEAAGLDLTAMGLISAMVSASGASLVNSGQAKTQLLARLAQAWNALNLSSLSGLTINADVTSGFSITSSMLRASAGSALVGTGLSATIVDGETLLIHTGVYADSAGNWTDNARIASALGLQEVKITLTNSNKPTFTVSSAGNNFKSSIYLVGPTAGGYNYMVTSVNEDKLEKAGLLSSLGINLESAAISVMPVTNVDSGIAKAAYLQAAQNAWTAKFNGLSGIGFTTGGAPTTIPWPTAQSIVNANGGTAGGIVSTNDPSTAVILDTKTLVVSTGVWVDSAGNFTTDRNVADLFGSKFKQIIYQVKHDSVADNTNYIIEISGQLPASLAVAIPDQPIGTNVAALTTQLKNHIIDEINARQAAATGTNEGEVFFDPSFPTAPFTPTMEQLAPKTVENPVGGNLTASIEVDGISSSLTGAPLGVLPKNTKLGDLILAVNNGLTAYLGVLQSAASGTLSGMGRIVTNAATPPTGPTGMDQVLDPKVDVSFYSGVLDRSLATGSYNNSGDVFGASAGFALTSAQFALLKSAGLDLSSLQLVSAMIKASASSTVSSADARIQLLAKLNEIWSALNMANMSAITVSGGVKTGFSALTPAILMACSLTSDFTGGGGVAILNEQKEMIVHTGVYADAKGNWTNDKVLASALGLKEIIYTIQNNDYTPVNASATFSTSAWWGSGGMSISHDVRNALIAAGFNTAVNTFTSANVKVSASAGSSADALLKLQNSALAYWTSTYGITDRLVFDKGNPGTGIVALTPTQIANSDGTNAANLTGGGDTDQIKSGGTIVIHTGIYYSAGNWTDNSALATAFGLEEVVYTITRGTTDYTAAAKIGSNNLPALGTFSGSYAANGLAGIGADVRDNLQAIIADGQKAGSNPNGGKLAISGLAPPPAPPTLAQLKAKVDGPPSGWSSGPLRYNGNLGGSEGELDIFVTLDGNSPVRRLGTNPTSDNVGTLANLLFADITGVLQQAQSLALVSGYNAGRLYKVPSSTHGGPAKEDDVPDLVTEDFYKAASGPKTVTTTGIVDKTKYVTQVASAGTEYLNASGLSNFGAWALASAINHNANSEFWAMVQPFDSQGHSADMVYVFTKKGGDFNSLLACDVADGDLASRDALQHIKFENVEANEINQSGTSFTLGGQKWGTFKPIQTKAGMGKEVWNLTLNGRDVGQERDLWIAALSDGKNEITTPGLNAGIINGLDRHSFVEIQNAANGPWDGAEVRTQSSAQEALVAINQAMERKDKVRADIGALQNRLENTITNLEIQMEALQASESRISDVDVATEMTEFVRNQVLAQAAVSMLSQANSLPQMALSLLNG
jgi:flagellin-like hook-associated protein FlgL